MSGPFFIGLTGLNANSLGIKNVGNNLANSNTIGYKATNVFFEELRAATTGGAEGGQGTLVASTQQVWTQGNVQQSQLATDMSIRGDGFFVVGDGISGEFYTRAGNFSLDREGKLVTGDGLYVMGYPLDSTGNINTNTNLVPLDLKPGKVLPANTTNEVRFTSNLQASAELGDTFSTTVLAYDSVGVSHPVTVTFTKTATANEWDFSMAATDGSDGSTVHNIASGTFTFSADGELDTVDVSGGPTGAYNPTPPNHRNITGLEFTPLSGGDTVTFDWNLFGDEDESFLTQFNLPNSTSQTFQNGNGAGSLSEVLVRSNGIVEGIFSNGETAELGQIGMAIFTSPQNLVRAGDNRYARTTQSGEPTVGTPDTGGRGRIQGNSLELSNVDIAEEFIKLILFQRAYQANSRMITTADQLTLEALQLKQ